MGARVVNSALKSLRRGFACPAGQDTAPSFPPGMVNLGAISIAPFARISGTYKEDDDAVAAAA